MEEYFKLYEAFVRGVTSVCDKIRVGAPGLAENPRCHEFFTEFRENEKYAAYFVRMLTLFDELNLPVEEMMLCLSGQHDLTVDFGGHRNFFSKSFYPKPIYNAHVLANKLGEEKLHYYTERDHDEFVSVLPSRHRADGHMSILMCYADDAFSAKRDTADFQVKFSGLDKEYRIKKYRIDKAPRRCHCPEHIIMR